jgi:hypothetical protein
MNRMKLLTAAWQVFATRDHPLLREMAREFRDRQSEANPLEVFLLLGALVLVVWFLWIAGHLLAPDGPWRRVPRPRQLFWEICRAHGFGRIQTLQLWRWAMIVAPENPLRVFVEPQWWTNHPAIEKLGTRERVEAIAARLFEGLGDSLEWQKT